ncbi:MAG: UDP-N-acetyl-D-galactosamine dehydrogenase [Flavobacteriaceae bacterium]|nr:UDP-N-acetyl-D-galactosamine dehydrogenase [Flavobacteriaceae bacterium]|tara:strand:- start:4353 stop:5645 length:1293 start_codon:yes stop_codon:yes gene_type:complete
MKKKYEIGIIGLGYVGLPLALEFAKIYKTIGFDIDSKRILELKNAQDSTNEISSDNLNEVVISDKNKFKNQKGLYLSNSINDLKNSNIYIVTVPTPTDDNNIPMLSIIKKASELVSKILKRDDIVIYESTVYPGVTEEICAPILEKGSKLQFNSDFFLGYSPERINPGDKNRPLNKILKVTSGSNKIIAKEIDNLYQKIITVGTYLAPSIKVAEASKVIENCQRDINIAFVNELSQIFNLLDIDTNEVLKAAETKWNFLPFKPGLVGGHCIGIDPYYLAQKAQNVGYNPEIILAGRRMNESMANYIAEQVIKLMINKQIIIKGSSLLMLGVTFKENCSDIRNSKVVDLIKKLKEYGINIIIYDPFVKNEKLKENYNLEVTNDIPKIKFDCIVLAVAHDRFKRIKLSKLKKENCVVYDVKGILGYQADGKL